MQTSASGPIDTDRVGFLSFARPLGEQRPGMAELRVSVEPETGDRYTAEIARPRSSFPLRPGKIQRPCLPEETLRRDRLLDWLEARSGRRVIYVIAEAGFGKTTLVADFLRRSQVRTFWYRLDEDDTDSLVFIRYLVAACQAVDARLLARSAALLADSSLELPREDAILDTLLAEIGSLEDMPSALVLDDFHLVESVPSIGALVERLMARAPAALKLIVVSRRTPGLSVAALRARGELAELGREELKFDELETGRLFRDSYEHPLEPEVLHELQARTDGWAASLQLVRTAVDGRSPGQVRSFVHSLSGADGDLYDYLAEEVVGDLEPEMRSFLVRTAILEDVEPETAAAAAGVSAFRARHLLADAQKLGLLSRGGDRGSTWRPHPLVREFLLAHLEAEMGEDGIAEMHRRLATVIEPGSWRLAARHWAAAGDADEVRRVVCAATPTIIGTGDLAAADEFVTRFPDPNPNPWFGIIRARRLFAIGRCQEALEEARRLHGAAAISASSDTSLVLAIALTLLNLGTELDDWAMRTAAVDVLRRCEDRELASIAKATEALYQAAEEGRLDSLRDLLLETLDLNRERGHSRFEGISLLNLANAQMPLDNPQAVIDAGTEAIRILQSAGNRGDMSAARLNVARGLAQIGRWQEALSYIKEVIDDSEQVAKPEVISEAAELEAMYGDPARGQSILGRVFSESERRLDDPFCRYVAARIALEHGRPVRAAELLGQIAGEALVPGFRSSRTSLELQIRSTANPSDPDLPAAFEAALRSAQSQRAWFWWKNMRATQALISPSSALADHFRSLEPGDAAHLSIQAELVLRRLADLDEPAFGTVRAEASLRPERWRWALRRFFSEVGHPAPNARRAAELLEAVGDIEDVPLLASLRQKRALHLPDAGRTLNRRLAPRAYVEDLGRVVIRIGDRTVPGTEVRRKVLSLLGFLLTRPQFTATREQVLEALWPEMPPTAGGEFPQPVGVLLAPSLRARLRGRHHSGLPQKPGGSDMARPGSGQQPKFSMPQVIASIRRDPSPELVGRLSEWYTGRFGVDFIYDDWASSFRDSLHASFLDRVERAVTLDIRAGAFDRALSVAQLALQADPEAEQIELCLLRIYRRTGASAAAAAEQYAHYAGVLREQLGVEPLPLEQI